MKTYIINDNDYENYKAAKPSNRITEIWTELLQDLSDELKEEALVKGFVLSPHPTIKEDGLTRTFVYSVPNASVKLNSAIQDIHYIVSLMKDW